MRCFILVAGALTLTGCGSAVPQAKLDEATAVVTECLEVWKKGGKPADLKALPRPIDFTEGRWTAGDALVRFEIQRTYYDPTQKMICCAVKWVLRDRRGKERTEQGGYDVKLDPPVTVAFNPLS